MLNEWPVCKMCVVGFAGHPIGSEELFGKNTLTPCATELSESENSHDVKTLPQIQRQFQAGLLQTKSGILESYSSWCKERFTRKRFFLLNKNDAIQCASDQV